VSGLKQGVDFKLGYSPERINPGDREHTLEKIVKVVSAEDQETLRRVSKSTKLLSQPESTPPPPSKLLKLPKSLKIFSEI
jgi:UDP-N-acetyl-D-galactosamine dehydrogenase